VAEDGLPGLADIETLLAAWQALQHEPRHEAAGTFFALLACPPWCDTGYDPAAAGKAIDDPQRIEDATLAELRPLLTWCGRGERFNAGHHAALLADGRLQRLMQRLSRIADAMAQRQTHAPLEPVAYATLNSRQRENHNFQKVSARLADYGYVTLRLSDDWQGADFIAQHIDGRTFLRVQLKSRMGVARKYRHRGLWLCFPHAGQWYLCPHDGLLEYLLAGCGIGHSASWIDKGEYTQSAPGRKHLDYLHRYRL
jgi:hypothetical protein